MKVSAYNATIKEMSAQELYTHCLALVQSPVLCSDEIAIYTKLFDEAKGDLTMTQVHWSRLMYIIAGQ